MDTKKIEGTITASADERLRDPEKDTLSVTVNVHPSTQYPKDALATLVIFPGEREKVFTESEVKAMLLQMCSHSLNSTFGKYMQGIAAQHGINLLPPWQPRH